MYFLYASYMSGLWCHSCGVRYKKRLTLGSHPRRAELPLPPHTVFVNMFRQKIFKKADGFRWFDDHAASGWRHGPLPLPPIRDDL